MSTNSNSSGDPRVCYIYTTFPIVSETFLQREMRVIRTKPIELTLHTIWGGRNEFEGQKVNRFRMWELVKLIFWLPYWIIQKPKTVSWFFGGLIKHPPTYIKNWLENLLGFAFAIIRAKEIERSKPELIHGVWATTPATAAIMLKKLIGIPYSMGSHAYDIFQKGGDCFLKEKIEESQFIHTSTKFAKSHLVEMGADPQKIHLIRRGLHAFPPLNDLRKELDVIKFLSIGRLVEKKGYPEQFRIYRDLRKRGIPFEVEIVGEGPLQKELEQLIKDYQIEKQVRLVGKVAHENIQTYYEKTDFFIFTGVIAKNGDRNGLANVIPEAMARGIPVLTTPDSGIVENFKSDHELVILPIRPVDEWVKKIKELAIDYNERKTLGTSARNWVERNFSAHKNSSKLYQIMLNDCKSRRSVDLKSEI